jgi:hypothetical protein
MSERNIDTSQVLFQVEMQEIYLQKNGVGISDDDRHKQREVFYEQINRFYAIVDLERAYTFTVVTEKYRLVKNEEAIDLGEQCFKQVFSEKTAGNMEIYNIIMPKTRSFCHVDFIHKAHGLEVWEGDKWWPYLRITNSYNKTKPLRFDIGFCRDICVNGVIFGRRGVEFRYYHTKGRIAPVGSFTINFQELKRMEAQFIEHLHNLKRYYVPENMMLPLLCRSLGISFSQDYASNPKKRDRFLIFINSVRSLTDKYFKDIGPNGYAALNVITDFASRPVSFISSESMIDPLQKKSGDWVGSFVKTIEDKEFKFETYLENEIKMLEEITA